MKEKNKYPRKSIIGGNLDKEVEERKPLWRADNYTETWEKVTKIS